MCAAKFVDDQWYRAKVEKLSGKDATVIYIDFGNKAVIPTAKCAALPASFHNPHGFAKEYLLAFMTLAPDVSPFFYFFKERGEFIFIWIFRKIMPRLASKP